MNATRLTKLQKYTVEFRQPTANLDHLLEAANLLVLQKTKKQKLGYQVKPKKWGGGLVVVVVVVVVGGSTS